MTKVSKKRHFVKSITWRIIATLTTILLAWIFTKDTSIALKFGAVEVIIKMGLYYFHERIWYKYSHFGVKDDKKLK
jgi:uncharacterized membrane protein